MPGNAKLVYVNERSITVRQAEFYMIITGWQNFMTVTALILARGEFVEVEFSVWVECVFHHRVGFHRRLCCQALKWPEGRSGRWKWWVGRSGSYFLFNFQVISKSSLAPHLCPQARAGRANTPVSLSASLSTLYLLCEIGIRASFDIQLFTVIISADCFAVRSLLAWPCIQID